MSSLLAITHPILSVDNNTPLWENLDMSPKHVYFMSTLSFIAEKFFSGQNPGLVEFVTISRYIDITIPTLLTQILTILN